jgi:hypothetical protein
MPEPPTTAYPYHDVPGHVEVGVVAYQVGDPWYLVTLNDGRVINLGKSLREMRVRYGGDLCKVRDPLVGLWHEVFLAPWPDANPDTTYVYVTYKFVPVLPIAPEHAHLFPPDARTMWTK